MMQALENVKKEYEKSGFKGGKVVELLKLLREEYLKIEDPTLVKITRLMVEHIEANNDFLIDTFEEERTEDDETSFAYLLHLMSESNNKFNREEIQEYKQLLLDDLS